MLTTAEITGHEFAGAAFGGYHKGDVDEFIESVARDYGELLKKNQVLEQKLRVLVQRIEEYRQTEENMRASLLTAQKRGEEIVENSKQLSAQLLSEAESEIKKRRHDTEVWLRTEEARLKLLHSETKEFSLKSLEIIEGYKEFLSKLEDLKITLPSIPESPAGAAAQTLPEEEDAIEADYAPVDSAVLTEGGAVDPFGTTQKKAYDYENLKFGYNYSADEE